ncbi:MAG: DUF4381 domain-containing protein [Gammaproteobacteria bacterium]
MNNAAASALQQLKDIQQPLPVSWWPLAPGWYILIGLFLILGAVGAYFSWRHWLKLRRRRLALKQLVELRQWFAKYTDKQYVASHLSILLKKALMVGYTRQKVAGLHGDDWLLFLDEVSRTDKYTHGCGRILVTAPYTSEIDDNLDDLFLLIEQTIKRCL